MNMSKEFWNEVERVKPKPTGRWSMGTMHPVLTIENPVLVGGATVCEDAAVGGYVAVRAYWVFPPETVRNYRQLEFGAPIPVTRISMNTAEVE